MSKLEEISKTLLCYADDILTFERELLDLDFALADARSALKDAEATALLEGVCDGKNQELREAQLREHVKMERIEVDLAERLALRMRLQLGAAKTMWQTWKAVGDWRFGKTG